MLQFALSILAALRFRFRGRRDTAPEVLTLRQQVVVLKRKRLRPPMNSLDRLLKLGFVVSEQTIARYLRPVYHRGDPGQRWLTFVVAAHRYLT